MRRLSRAMHRARFLYRVIYGFQEPLSESSGDVRLRQSTSFTGILIETTAKGEFVPGSVGSDRTLETHRLLNRLVTREITEYEGSSGLEAVLFLGKDSE